MAENVSSLLNFPSETFRQTLDQLHRRASSLVSLSLQWKDFDEHLISVNSAIRERAEELHSNQASVARALEGAENRERRLDEKERDLELKEERLEENRKGFDEKFKDLESKEKMVQEWAEEVESEKYKYEKLCKEIQSKQKEVNQGYSAIIDGKTLQVYLNEHSGEADSMRFAVSMALGNSSDPAMLVLDALQGFHPPHLKKGEIEFEGEVVRRSCSVLLEELMKFSPKIQPSVKKEARRIACDWVSTLKSNEEHFLEVLCFLQLLACYGLASAFDKGKLLAQLEIVSNHSLAPLLFRALGFTNEVSDFVHTLIGKKKLNEAIKFIHEFDIVGQFQPVSLLNDFLGKDLTPKEQISTPEKRLADIKYALRCIDEYKIDYGPAHQILEQQVGFLEKEISKRKEEASLGDKFPMLNEKEDLSVGQVRMKSEFSSPSKEELKTFLEMYENNQTEDGEIAAALRSSHNPEKLVLEIMNVPIPFTPSGFKDVEIELRDEAIKFALCLEPILRKKSNKSPLEAICFLQFLASFKLGSAFFSHELLSLLETDHWHKESPDLCDDLGLTDKIPSFIQNQINRGKFMEAVKYIYALNMVDKFNPASVLEVYLSKSSKNSNIGSLETQIEGIDKEIRAHEEVPKCVADYQIGSLSPEKLKERIAQLEKEKQELRTRQERHGNKRQRTRVLPEYGQSWNGDGLSAPPLQYPPLGQDVVFSPFRQHVWPVHYPPHETELNGYMPSVGPA